MLKNSNVATCTVLSCSLCKSPPAAAAVLESLMATPHIVSPVSHLSPQFSSNASHLFLPVLSPIPCDRNLCGFCRFGPDRCQYLHVLEMCKDTYCLGMCHRRHPMVCHYFAMFRQCKFKQHCAYRHTQPVSKKDNKLESFENGIEELRKQWKIFCLLVWLKW